MLFPVSLTFLLFVWTKGLNRRAGWHTCRKMSYCASETPIWMKVWCCCLCSGGGTLPHARLNSNPINGQLTKRACFSHWRKPNSSSLFAVLAKRPLAHRCKYQKGLLHIRISLTFFSLFFWHSTWTGVAENEHGSWNRTTELKICNRKWLRRSGWPISPGKEP